MLHCLGEPFNRVTNHLANADVSYIEVVDDGLHALDKKKVSTLKSLAVSYGFKYSVHAPFADINIASLSKSILRATLKRMKQSIAYASALDAYMWVFHPGLRSGISMFYPGMDWLQNLESARSLFMTADDYGVKIAIENVPEPFPFLMKSTGDFQKFYSEINEDIGLVLDIGHANINNQNELFLTKLSNKIVHIHASDNNGKEDQHLGIGQGTINWEAISKLLTKILYNKTLIIESVEHVEASKQRLEHLFT
jgi:sugar phosphate isomerase/epimerase